MPNNNGKRLHGLRSRFTRGSHEVPDESMPEVEATRPCPYCKERISRGATVCMFCERDIVAVMSPQAFNLKFGPRPAAETDDEPMADPESPA